MKFKSRKDNFFKLVFAISFLLMVAIIAFNFKLDKESIIASIIILLTIVFLGWIYFGTNYQLQNHYLKYKCGPIRGKIAINTINEIEKNKTLWAGFRPATATKGLIIRYNKFDEIYITPESNDSFIDEILKINSAIVIK